jgi:Flp pilus assembly protein TadB
MTNSDPIGLWLAASVTTGVAAHVALAARERRAYRRLREAYVGAVSAAQETGAADALVGAQELHREFMRTTPPPGWLTGLGARIQSALVLCAVAGVAAMVATGRLPPVVAGVAVLLAIGLRRILLATALLLALFVATNMVSPPRGADRTPTTAFSAPPHAPPKALGRSR